jgi:hypothetical protein
VCCSHRCRQVATRVVAVCELQQEPICSKRQVARDVELHQGNMQHNGDFVTSVVVL